MERGGEGERRRKGCTINIRTIPKIPLPRPKYVTRHLRGKVEYFIGGLNAQASVKWAADLNSSSVLFFGEGSSVFLGVGGEKEGHWERRGGAYFSKAQQTVRTFVFLLGQLLSQNKKIRREIRSL